MRSYFFGNPLKRLNNGDHCAINAALKRNRIDTGSHGLHAFINDRLREQSGGGGAVARHFIGFGSDLFDQFRAKILELVFKCNFFSNRDAVFGDGRRAVAAVDYDIPPLGAERHFNGVRELVDAAAQRMAAMFGV